LDPSLKYDSHLGGMSVAWVLETYDKNAGFSWQLDRHTSEA